MAELEHAIGTQALSLVAEQLDFLSVELEAKPFALDD